MSDWYSEDVLAATPWPRFRGEALFESLINHFGFDIEDEQRFRDYLKNYGVDDPESYFTDSPNGSGPQELLAVFKSWAEMDPEWVGSYSSYRERRG